MCSAVRAYVAKAHLFSVICVTLYIHVCTDKTYYLLAARLPEADRAASRAWLPAGMALQEVAHQAIEAWASQPARGRTASPTSRRVLRSALTRRSLGRCFGVSRGGSGAVPGRRVECGSKLLKDRFITYAT